MGVRRAHEAGVQDARDVDVVEIAAGAGQEPEILLARQRRPQRRAHAGCPVADIAAAAFMIARTMLW